MGGPKSDLTKYLNIIKNGEDLATTPRLVWCPYVEEEEKEGEDPLHLLGVISGKHADLYFLNTIKEVSCQSEVEIDALESIEGAVIGVDTESEITSVRIRFAFSRIYPLIEVLILVRTPPPLLSLVSMET